jgi:myo-inositol 2-dehydrogenase / D-chiro-inositol 1-dehydrogenase
MSIDDRADRPDGLSRREFLKTTSLAGASLATAVTTLSNAGVLYASGTAETIRVGLVGCGGRGTGAAIDCVRACPDVAITAMGDLFPDMMESSRKRLGERLPKENFAVTPETCFSGFDCDRKVAAAGVDMLILAAPPFFRPAHFRTAVEAGKHVFMEKPVAVDAPGVRSVIATAEIAAQKRLGVVAGTQRRHQAHYLEILKRVHDGQIGEITGGQCYWNQGYLWIERAARNWSDRIVHKWSDMEWQVRNWLFTVWCSGDHIVEQHIHNIDVMNWAFGTHPVKATGMGGRAARVDPMFGNVYDHFAVEYEYPSGVRVMSMCRQIGGCAENVSERLVGTSGVAYTDGADGNIQGAKPYRPEKESPNPFVQEHANLIASIRAGRPLNEGRQVAESTLTAIMGRMSAYTGRALSWDWAMNASTLDLTPPHMEMKELPPLAIAVPGRTELT